MMPRQANTNALNAIVDTYLLIKLHTLVAQRLVRLLLMDLPLTL